MLLKLLIVLSSGVTEAVCSGYDLRQVLGKQRGRSGYPPTGRQPSEAATAQEEPVEGRQLHVPPERPAGQIRRGPRGSLVDGSNGSLDRVGGLVGLQCE